MIKVLNLCKSYFLEAEEVKVLRNLNLEIKRGESISIVGKSGVGKSTLIHIIGAIDTPSSGRVFFENSDIHAMSPNKLAEFRNKNIGFVFQFHHLLNDFTALENVAMPALIRGTPQEETNRNAREILEMVGLGDRIKHKPGELSGGEQQRVAVARAISLKPSLVLADEPTGNLDSQTGQQIFKILLNLCTDQKISLVIVTHDENLAAKTDRCLRIVDGKID